MVTFQVLPDPTQPALYITNVAITDDTRGVHDQDFMTTAAPVPSGVNGFSFASA